MPATQHALHANPLALPWAILGGGLVILAAAIYIRQHASRVAVLFSGMIVLVAAWFVGFAGMLQSQSAAQAVLWSRGALTAVALMPAAIYQFTITSLRIAPLRQRLLRLFWLFSIGFAVIAATTSGFVDDVARHSWGYYPEHGWALAAFLVFFFGALAMQMGESIREYRRTSDTKRRRRLMQMIVSFAIVYLGAIDFVPMFGVAQPPLGYVAVLIFILVTWGAIWRHRLVSITAATAADDIVAMMTDALFVLDAEGRIRVMNGAVERLIGYRKSELLGKSIATIDAKGGRALIEVLRTLRSEGVVRDQEHALLDREGRRIDVSVSISPVHASSTAGGVVVIARDIRERKRAEEELHSFMARLQESNRELEDFAHVASHDLQEPLRKIRAFGDLLKSRHSDSLAPQARDYIERMQSAATRMQVLIEGLLTFSRVTTKGQPFDHVDLTHVAGEVVHDLEARVHAAQATVTIDKLPTITADPLQMRQLLQNLIANALKFHRPEVPPVIRLSAEVAERDDTAPLCRLLVADNGIGFEPAYAERIFGVFERLHARSQYEGTGIGLAICRKIVQRHGGSIVAHSRPGEGTTFQVTLPVHHMKEEMEHGGNGKTDHDSARG